MPQNSFPNGILECFARVSLGCLAGSFRFWLVVASASSPCSLMSSCKPNKSHLCPVRGRCRLRWRKAGLELELKAQNGRRGCGGSTRSPLGSPGGYLPRRIPAHVGGRRGTGNCPFFFAYFFIDFFCFQSTWFLTSRSLLKVFGFLFSVVSFHQGTSFLRARIQQVQVPLGDAVRPSHLLTSQLPLMWQLYPAQRYMDNNSRLWQIQHHLMVHMLLNFPSHRGSL